MPLGIRMNHFFSNLFKREASPATGLTANKNADSGGYRQNIVYVNNSETAMKIAAVYRAVNLISSSAAVLTLQYKRLDRAKGYFKLHNKLSVEC